ncbi:uncharacterized protein LOC110100045 isoform X1 [Dendrobium catenatum]|uniref:uncharacterized protein LOC110100045 isoform X1 n=1 Tax=Dendrobium catenatum TaxID=906689 RepID=UPI0009F5A90B|nr:uncharacterized protein LOC110100045 isoform X1 [Dendrobium catenatum]
MKPMNTLLDVVEEAKVRTVFWAICVFGISYFLSHTSKSMWMNIPISVLILVAFRYLSYEVELHWKVRAVQRQTYLSHLEKKQLSVDDPRLSRVTTATKWRGKIDSPIVETAIDDFINKILQDFVVDLWYSSITPDKEAPELIRTLILDALGEISGRIKQINLVELLTRDMVDLIGNQLDLFRKNQSKIGTDMGTLSFEERDDRLKRQLMASRELHPALVSPEFEHKVLQQMVGGVLAVVLRPQEAQCSLVRCISRELLTCLVVQPIMSFASPVYVNELIEYIFLSNNANVGTEVVPYGSLEATYPAQADKVLEANTLVVEPEHSRTMSSTHTGDLVLSKADGVASGLEQGHQTMLQGLSPAIQPRAAEWALILEAATKRRTQVLTPENLENMWTKGRNYKKKTAKLMKAEASSGSGKIDLVIMSTDIPARGSGKEFSTNTNKNNADLIREESCKSFHSNDGSEETTRSVDSNNQLKRSNSTPDMDTSFTCKGGENIIYKDYYGSNFRNHKEEPIAELVSHGDGSLYVPKLKCRVVGAYFEKLGSNSFAVYSIAVTDAENKTWFVKRRYRNFERLHRHLKEIRNYSLSLPPKRFLSSSIDDYFVHQRCILLDKYLQDLLAIANIAEQHEVWDFLSASSKNYSFGKSTSVMKTLAVNMDDAMDDIVRQFKRKVVGSSPSHMKSSTQAEHSITLPLNEGDTKKMSPTYSNMETYQSVSDDDAHDEDQSSTLDSGWHSDNELKGLPPRIIKRKEESNSLVFEKSEQSEQFKRIRLDTFSTSNNLVASDTMEDLAQVPPEWTPPNVSVPLLNLVDNIFQLNRRGWLRRQVLWISKQVLQLIMEDAIDDWILRQIHWLRKDEVIAHGIHWVQDILWPNGTFFIKFGSSQEKANGNYFNQKSTLNRSQRYSDKVGGPSSFEFQLEATRRASDVKKMILGGAPTALVSLIGHRQYRRCAKDVYYFLQSSVCLKQLGYSMLELVIVSIFPEMRDLIIEIHQKQF